ncbi:MAG: diguanylate cyclase [Actinomycetota bacterium]
MVEGRGGLALSLQSRLFSLFTAIVLLPLATAGFLVQRLVVRDRERDTSTELRLASEGALILYGQRVLAARVRVTLVIQDPQFRQLLTQKRYAELEPLILGWLLVGEIDLDFVVVADARGVVLARMLKGAGFLPQVKAPTAEEIVRGQTLAAGSLPLTRTVATVPTGGPSGEIAVVYGGYYLGSHFARWLARGHEKGITILIQGQATGSTLPSAASWRGPVPMPVEETAQATKTRLGDQKVYAVLAPLSRDLPISAAALVTSSPEAGVVSLARRVNLSIVILMIVAAVGAGILAFVLARATARPLRELAAGANAIAAGNYDQHIRVRSSDEVGQLARAFNEMAERLAVHVAELGKSREELKRALARFGETLRSTHDLRKMLQVVLDTSLDTLHARRGLLMLMNASRDGLVVSLARGITSRDFELKLDEGVAGYVAATGDGVRIPDGKDLPLPAPQEPPFRTALSIPIFSEERVIAVLSLFDKQGGRNFTEADLGTLTSLADQAGVAIENVLLHQEAQQLAITDALTGIWNYRYFQREFEQEIDRATRFKRPFSLVMFDLDDFKSLNDTYGHQRGDAVLAELARRVRDAIRDIDVFARYGGEEFVLVLPETDADGGLRTAEKVRRLIASAPFGQEPSAVTISAGVASFPIHGTDGSSLLRAADLAMYEAKAGGKNRAVLYRPPRPEMARVSGR